MNYVILNKDNYKFFVDGYLECIKDLNNENVELSSAEDMEYMMKNQSSNITVFVGIEDGEVVCTATLIMERKLRYKQPCCHIEDVAVKSDKRKEGYGKQIVQCCIDTAQKYKCYKVKLNCAPHLVSFYANLGISDMQMHMYHNINYGQ